MHINYKAILFDFDGVIGDTMEANYLAWKKTLSLKGISLERKEYFLLEGLPPKEVYRTICTRNKHERNDEDQIVATKEDFYLAMNYYRIYPYVEEILNKLWGIFFLGLVTSASRGRIMKTIRSQLLSNFDTLITSNDTLMGKPHPSPYLLASEGLNIAPDKCLVVENAPLGIQSAKSAGMDCVALTTTLPVEYLSEADQIFGDLMEFYRWISFEITCRVERSGTR